MEIKINALHFELTDSLRNYVTEKINSLAFGLDKMQVVEVSLVVEKNSFITRIFAKYKTASLFSEATGIKDMYAAINAAVSKIEKQLIKQKKV